MSPPLRQIAFAAAFAVLACCLAASAQNPQLETKNGKAFPTVVFTSVLWNRDPSYYTIAIDTTGNFTYQSSPNSAEKTGVPYTVELEVTGRCRAQIFALVDRLHDFQGHFSTTEGYAGQKNVKTLAYHYEKVNNQITFTSSPNPAIQQLNSIFDRLAATLESTRTSPHPEAQLQDPCSH